MAPEGLRMAPKWLQIAPKWLRIAPKCSEGLRMTSKRMLDRFGIFFTVGAMTKNEREKTYFILMIKYTKRIHYH